MRYNPVAYAISSDVAVIAPKKEKKAASSPRTLATRKKNAAATPFDFSLPPDYHHDDTTEEEEEASERDNAEAKGEEEYEEEEEQARIHHGSLTPPFMTTMQSLSLMWDSRDQFESDFRSDESDNEHEAVEEVVDEEEGRASSSIMMFSNGDCIARTRAPLTRHKARVSSSSSYHRPDSSLFSFPGLLVMGMGMGDDGPSHPFLQLARTVSPVSSLPTIPMLASKSFEEWSQCQFTDQREDVVVVEADDDASSFHMFSALVPLTTGMKMPPPATMLTLMGHSQARGRERAPDLVEESDALDAAFKRARV